MTFHHLHEDLTLLAGQFCSWAEDTSISPEDDIDVAVRLLSSLYQAQAVSLDNCEFSGAFDLPEAPGSVREHFKRLPFDAFWEFPHPLMIPTADIRTYRVSDFLTLVYRQLSAGLSLESTGNADDAKAYWQSAFGKGWGAALLSALKVLHYYKYR